MKTVLMIALPLAAALLVVLWDRLRLRRTMGRLDAMVEQAVQGAFPGERFDESSLSALESKLAQALSASSVSTARLAEEKEKIKTLIGDISHQTKTPVANLLLYAQLLSELDLPEEGRAYAAALEAQAEKLGTFIEDLVKLSRLETGILRLHPCRAPLAPVLEEAVTQFVPKAGERGVELVCVPTETEAIFDAKWTEEALCNLLDNAIKYTPPGGEVTAAVTVYEMFCSIDVADTGPGIPEAEQARVFQRFYRAPNAHGTEGVGIGLYLVRQIAQGQGGYVKLLSRAGQGTKFSLFLPRV